jgi:hypothetical protein
MFNSSGCYKDVTTLDSKYQLENNLQKYSLHAHHMPATSAVCDSMGIDKKEDRDKIRQLLPSAPCYKEDHRLAADSEGRVTKPSQPERQKQVEALSKGEFKQLSEEKFKELKEIGEKSGNDYQKGIESAKKYSEKVEPIINSQIERQKELNQGGLSVKELEQKKEEFTAQQASNLKNEEKIRSEVLNASGLKTENDKDYARLSQNNPEFADKLGDLRAAELQTELDKVYENNLNNEQIKNVQQNTLSSSNKNENESETQTQSTMTKPTNQNTQQRNNLYKNNDELSR